jgi:His-Xaa-Ser system radical SAM maturase HxsB
VLLTNLVGEHVWLSEGEFDEFAQGHPGPELVPRLRAKHIICTAEERAPLELLAAKLRTRLGRLRNFTALHIFVVTLRCEHSCPYCQVSRQTSARGTFDMTRATADKSIDLVFRSPAPHIKIEFQGGEPLMNFDLIQHVVSEATARNADEGRDLQFVIATNLALLDEEVLAFCAAHEVVISTSLDGPADLHNRNRPRRGRDSWERATDGIVRVREQLGVDRVSALMTTTESSLDRVREIIDTYVDLGLGEIFLRPLSPYGFAVRSRSYSSYGVERWLDFYREGIEYIIELNRQGVDLAERYACIVLRKMLTNTDPGYVDLTSPAGIGIGALVYNYDGKVFASDEGRMLAEMNDRAFELGDVHEHSYADIMLSSQLLEPLEASFALSAPMCTDCAYEPWCGADPVYHHATQGEAVGRKPVSDFCHRNMGVFELMLELYERDAFTRGLLLDWSSR